MRVFLICLLVLPFISKAQDTSIVHAPNKIKTGWNLGALPVIAFSTDVGFKYGAVANLFNFGNGKNYPLYDHSFYLEISRTSRGSGLNQLLIDSRKLIPRVRTMIEASILTEKALDFYGFNGYNSMYNRAYTNTESPEYISRMYYRMERSIYKYRTDLFGNIGSSHFKWFGGIEFMAIHTNTVDIDNLNKGLSKHSSLPDTSLLYDNYVKWGIIDNKDKNGGNTTLVKGGLIYDTRNEESNPMKGIWTEMQLIAAPSFLCTNANYLRLILTHRQYFTVVPNRLSFVYRLSYQGKLAGTMPFYMLPFIYNTAPNYTRDGLGGNHSIRGVLRNRIMGEDYAFTNIELRWKFWITEILNQNFYFALSGFMDAGMTTKSYHIDLSSVPSEYLNTFNYRTEIPHVTYGGGIRAVMNDNFILALDMGVPFDKQDGHFGAYLFLSWLF